MNRKQRIEYAAISLGAFVPGFMIYGMLGAMHPMIESNGLWHFFLFGLGGGVLFGGIYSGIHAGVRFFTGKRLLLKVVAAIFAPLTALAILYVGVVMHIPYGIYNLIKISNTRNTGSAEELTVDEKEVR